MQNRQHSINQNEKDISCANDDVVKSITQQENVNQSNVEIDTSTLDASCKLHVLYAQC